MDATVLVGTDGTAGARVTVDRAAELAARMRATLIVLAVVQTPVITTPVGPRGVDALVADQHRRRRDAERAVRDGAAAAEALGVRTTPLVRTGDPAQQIIAVADEAHAATIVVGDRGLDPAGRYVLDSVPAAVALHARAHDVLIVRTPREAERDTLRAAAGCTTASDGATGDDISSGREPASSSSARKRTSSRPAAARLTQKRRLGWTILG